MCSNNNGNVCGGRNAIAYDNDNRFGCGCGSSGEAYNNTCGCENNVNSNECGCGENLLGRAACGAINTVFRVIRGLDRSVGGCGSGCNGHGNGCGCGR